MTDTPEVPSAAARRLAELIRAPGPIPLDVAVGLLAADEDSEVTVEAVIEAIDGCARGLHIPDGAPPIECVARLNTHLFAGLGFRGDTESYDDPRNSLMHRVVARRQGLPILLSVLYVEIARRVGFAVDGVGYPGHFIVRPRDADPVFYVDPFNGGEVRRADLLEARLHRLVPESREDPAVREQFMGPVDTRYVLLRMTNNLRASYLRRADGEGVLRSVLRLAVLQPDVAAHRRDLGLVLLGLGRVDEGGEILDHYLAENPDAPEATVLREHLLGARNDVD